MELIPNEIICKIFLYLRNRSILVLVCRKWRDLVPEVNKIEILENLGEIQYAIKKIECFNLEHRRIFLNILLSSNPREYITLGRKLGRVEKTNKKLRRTKYVVRASGLLLSGVFDEVERPFVDEFVAGISNIHLIHPRSDQMIIEFNTLFIHVLMRCGELITVTGELDAGSDTIDLKSIDSERWYDLSTDIGLTPSGTKRGKQLKLINKICAVLLESRHEFTGDTD